MVRRSPLAGGSARWRSVPKRAVLGANLPRSADSCSRLAAVYARMGRHADAVTALEDLVRIDPENRAALVRLAATYADMTGHTAPVFSLGAINGTTTKTVCFSDFACPSDAGSRGSECASTCIAPLSPTTPTDHKDPVDETPFSLGVR